MIIFLLSVISLIVGIVLVKLFEDNDINDILLFIGAIGIFICVMIILLSHVGVNAAIETKQIEYESLCKRLEIVNSDYEDVSKSEVVKDITVWNVYVTKSRYWTYNPWTSWFNSKKLTDSLKYIELEVK